jgi:endonuclease YncB( thermonuclease family)
MKCPSFKFIYLTFVFAMFTALPAFGQPEVINAKVVSVETGDTIVIRDFRNREHKLRLKGIAAPDGEVAERSRNYLSTLVSGKYVRIVRTKYDREGLLVGKATFRGRDISLEMVIAGMARHFTGYAHDQPEEERQFYKAAESNARKSGFNIWASSTSPPD